MSEDTITFKIHFTADLTFKDMPKGLAEEIREQLTKLKTKSLEVEEVKT